MMLTPSIKVERSGVQLIHKQQISEPPWKQYARRMLPLSPVAKKTRESKNWPTTDDLSEFKRDSCTDIKTFDQEDDKRIDLVIGVKPRSIVPSENGPQNQNNRNNAMLKRLADCFAYKQRTVKSGGKRHRVLGFYPRLNTINENASELSHDLDATYDSLNSDTIEEKDFVALNTGSHSPVTKDCSFDHSTAEFTPCCQTNDQKIAALHADIKELWMRLENVEKRIFMGTRNPRYAQ